MLKFKKEKNEQHTKNAQDSDGGKASEQIKKTILMEKKEHEHEDIFHPKKENQEKPDSKFEQKVRALSLLLANSATTLKKSENKKDLKNASLTLMGSGIKMIAYAQELLEVQEKTKETKSDINISSKVLQSLVSSMSTAKKLFSPVDLDSLEREDYETHKSTIDISSKSMVLEMCKVIEKSKLKMYGFEEVILKYERNLKKLVKTIEAFENENADKMPLMGTEGSN